MYLWDDFFQCTFYRGLKPAALKNKVCREQTDNIYRATAFLFIKIACHLKQHSIIIDRIIPL